MFGRFGVGTGGLCLVLVLVTGCAESGDLDAQRSSGGSGNVDAGAAGGSGGAAGSGSGGTGAGTCGDLHIDPGEQCDGSELGGKTCVSLGGFVGGTLACTLGCAFDTGACQASTTCGNDLRERDEECDGTDLAAHTCQSEGFTAGDLACDVDCFFDRSDCTRCGDDLRTGDEACDGSDFGGASCGTLGHAGGALACTGNCTLIDEGGCNECGNLTIDQGEQCDGTNLGTASCASLGGAFDGGVLACGADCAFDTSRCTTPATCPNGLIDSGEQCDGSNLNQKTCALLGYTGGVLSCQAGCNFDLSRCYTCGNGQIEGGEVCDASDLGQKTCASEGFDAGTLACASSCLALDTSDCSLCGDHRATGTEACDDLDLAGSTCQSLGLGGGQLACTAGCRFDVSDCGKCGNGAIDSGEECDGSNLGGATCASLGLGSGNVTCSACHYVTSGCTPTSTCDPDGTYQLSAPISYSCCGGNVNFSISSFTFTGDGNIVAASPTLPVTLNTPVGATTCPSGSFSKSGQLAGTCTEYYEVSGTFVSDKVWTGTFKANFIGTQCSGQLCQILGGACTNQSIPVTATRP